MIKSRCLNCNLGHNIWRKVKKIKQNWTEPERLDMYLCICAMTAITEVLFLEGRLCTLPNLEFFLLSPNFLIF